LRLKNTRQPGSQWGRNWGCLFVLVENLIDGMNGNDLANVWFGGGMVVDFVCVPVRKIPVHQLELLQFAYRF
jgi:hypothetical protein